MGLDLSVPHAGHATFLGFQILKNVRGPELFMWLFKGVEGAGPQ